MKPAKYADRKNLQEIKKRMQDGILHPTHTRHEEYSIRRKLLTLTAVKNAQPKPCECTCLL